MSSKTRIKIGLFCSLALCACSEAGPPSRPQQEVQAHETQTEPEENRPAQAEATDPAAVLATLDPPYVSARLDNGRRLWGRCSTCHSFDGSRSALPGPDLQGVLGAEAGSQAGFSYSRALREADFVWTTERLDTWLASPDGFLEGNAMSFAGVSDPQDRRDLIACIAIGQACLEGGR